MMMINDLHHNASSVQSGFYQDTRKLGDNKCSTRDHGREMQFLNLNGEILLQAFLPQLGADQSLRGQPGRIINISSIQGKYGTPFMAAYTASKHGVEGLSECMRRELMPYGIDVVIVGEPYIYHDSTSCSIREWCIPKVP